MGIKEITLLEELCGKCDGCSTRPTSIEQLCSNSLEKYLYRMKPSMGTEGEAYFRGRKDGLMMRGANNEQIFKAGIKEVVDWIKTHKVYCPFATDMEWDSQLKEWGIDA